MTPAIRDAVARHRLKDRVLLLGRLSEEMLTTLYRGADLFVMPNVHVEGDIEGFGVVMLEAGLAGLPTVAADLEGVRDVICEERNGTLVPSGDADAFAAAVRRYAADRQALASASRDAARFTATTFGWPAVADRYVRVLHGVRGEVEQLSAVDDFNRRLREPG